MSEIADIDRPPLGPAEPDPRDAAPDFDVVIIGAGLSGIGAAYHLNTRLPNKRYCILEGRDAIGGTWDLFRYPGVRSDSDMFTLGYRFRPWRDAKAIADGPAIRSYVREAAREYGIEDRIRFNHWVTDFSWSSASNCWTITAKTGDEERRITCRFVWNCSGYYRYAEGYTPEFPGAARFEGRIVHPQRWPEDLDYKGKKVVVIGSGATAVTLIPSMADETEHITMLQRSPTYMFAMPGTSPLAKFLGRILPGSRAYRVMRGHRIIFQQIMFKMARARPEKTKERLIGLLEEKLPPGYDIEKHFTPTYNPWDQRICLVPDDDLFDAIRRGEASVVTDQIETFTEKGIRLASGREIEADIIITATGLILEALGGATVKVDGERISFGDKLTYRGMMFEDVPNLASVFGYTNASWTLRADLVSDYVCRLLAHMDRTGAVAATPVNDDPDMPREPFLDFSSGYVRRAEHLLPKQGRAPWRHPQDFFRDLIDLKFGRVDDGVLKFTAAEAARASAASERR